MRYENIYSSFPCPVSGHFSAASRRVAPISACVFSQRLSGRANLNPKVELKTFPLARAHLGTSTAYLCNVNKNSSPPPLRLRTDMSPW